MNADDLVYEYLETAETCLEIAVRELESRAKNGIISKHTAELVKTDRRMLSFIRETRLSFLEELKEAEEYEDEDSEEFDRRIGGSYE